MIYDFYTFLLKFSSSYKSKTDEKWIYKKFKGIEIWMKDCNMFDTKYLCVLLHSCEGINTVIYFDGIIP